MDFTDREMDVARRCLNGDLNETQINYIAHTEGIDRKKLERLVDDLAYRVPMAAVVKIMLAYMMFNFLFCLFYSLMMGL